MNKVAKLTHYGRKSGKAYTVKVWFAAIDDVVWIGSLDDERSWVKNVEAGQFDLDLGKGAVRYRATPAGLEEGERFRSELRKLHPIVSRILFVLVRKNQCAFRCDPVG